MQHPPAGITLRTATLDDVAACARLHTQCWREAYGPLLDPDRLAAAIDVTRSEERWREQLRGGAQRLLALRDGVPVGFSASGPSRDEDAPTPVELYALYVAAAEWGRGIGRLLLAEELGGDSASLWVLEDNRRARAFYERHGFVTDGARVTDPTLGAWEVRMVRRVDHPVRA